MSVSSYIGSNGNISAVNINNNIRDIENKIYCKIFGNDIVYNKYVPNTNQFYASSMSFSKKLSEDIGEDIAEKTITTYTIYNTIRSIDNEFKAYAFTIYNNKLTQNEKLLISTDMLVFRTKYFDVIYDKRRDVSINEVITTLNSLHKDINMSTVIIYVNNGITEKDYFKYYFMSEYYLSTIPTSTLYINHPCFLNTSYLLAICEYKDIFKPTFHE